MSRLWAEGKPIVMETDAQARPVRFLWQAQPHQLAQIHQRWQVDVDWWREEGHAAREYLAVTTLEGLFCVIYRDLGSGQWYMAKVYD
jgi:N12 class adenine-specific DNA methylase